MDTQRLTFVEVAADRWLRVDQIASVEPSPLATAKSRIYRVGPGYVDSGLTVDQVMARIEEAAR